MYSSIRDDLLAFGAHNTARRGCQFAPTFQSSCARACSAILVIFAGIFTAAVTADAAQRTVMTLSIVNGAVAGVGDTLKVQQGDDLELRWSSDKPIELHLHGYDLEVTVSPEAPAVMSFKANIAGRFPIESHGQGPRHRRPVLYLEVHP
jgi:hypothetical protein